MKLLDNIVNLIFPSVCGLCDEINESFLCDRCREKVDLWKISSINSYNTDDIYFKEHCYIFKYENEIREFFIDYKFNEKSYMYKTFSRIIVEDKIFNEFISKYDCVVSVPLHKKRLKNRGYNQSKLIAKDVAKFYGLDFYDDVLVKKVNNVPQSSLNKEERAENIENVFEVVNFDVVRGRKVVLFDDIFTTGCTVNECARLLEQAGVDSVGVFTFAKD